MYYKKNISKIISSRYHIDITNSLGLDNDSLKIIGNQVKNDECRIQKENDFEKKDKK